MVKLHPTSLLGLAFLALPLLVTATSEPPPPSETMTTNAEVICSTEDPTDCYPRIFEPTKDFQVIKEGQDLPPGLHVRIDMTSGKKTARLNIPMEGEAAEISGDIPTEQAIIVVPQPDEPEAEPEKEKSALRDQVPNKPPAYESAGKIPPPPPSGDDFGTFQKALLVVKMEARAFDSALDDLAELAHDIYYGLEIAKDIPTLERLVCFTLGLGSLKMDAKVNERERKAASILAASIQNNPTALQEVSNYWQFVMKPQCQTQDVTRDKGHFVATLRGGLGQEKSPATLKAKVGAINGLLKEPLIRDEFLKKNGMELLLAMFLKKGEDFDQVRRKIGQLVMDNFLDEGMGAEVGVWPKTARGNEKTCTTKGKMLQDGCWEHHVEAFSERAPGEEWATELLTALGEQRGKLAENRRGREL